MDTIEYYLAVKKGETMKFLREMGETVKIIPVGVTLAQKDKLGCFC